jgi:diguanylate cyclase (GGDEF)-like protein/PAS domain S-box-containing protein
VEDEGLLAYELERGLRELDYSVAGVVPSGAEALEALPYARPDVVLLDLELEAPEDSIALAQQIRQRSAVPVVFVSSGSDPDLVARAQAASPYGFVFKPFLVSALRAVLDTAVQRHQIERELARKTVLLEAVVRSMEDAVLATDEHGRILVFNEAAREAFGTRTEVDAESARYGLFLPDESRCPPEDLPLLRAMRGESIHAKEFLVRGPACPEGRWYSINSTPLRTPDGRLRGGVMVSRDVSQAKAAQEDLEKLSLTDPLTGTYNRRGFVTAAKRKLAESDQPSALFFVDLNGMKQINDTLGHAQGDQAIVDVTALLKDCLGEADLVGRLGGDEFAVLAPRTDGDELAQRLRSALDTFNQSQERQYRLSISIGRSSYHPESPEPVESLVELADLQMYRDKQERRARRGPSLTATALPSSPGEAAPDPEGYGSAG